MYPASVCNQYNTRDDPAGANRTGLEILWRQVRPHSRATFQPDGHFGNRLAGLSCAQTRTLPLVQTWPDAKAGSNRARSRRERPKFTMVGR